MSAQHKKLIDRPPQLAEEATYQARLRSAVYDGISQADVKDIVANLVQRAKDGDAKATDMVFKHLIAPEGTHQTLIQNNYYDGEEAAEVRRGRKPKRVTAEAPAGKLSVLRARAEAGEELFDAE